MQKRATLQPPHKHSSRTASLRGGRYQPNRTRCKLVMTVSLIGKHSKKCTFYTLRFGCSFAAVNTIKPQLL